MFGEKLRRQSVNLHCCAMTSIQKSALRSRLLPRSGSKKYSGHPWEICRRSRFWSCHCVCRNRNRNRSCTGGPESSEGSCFWSLRCLRQFCSGKERPERKITQFGSLIRWRALVINLILRTPSVTVLLLPTMHCTIWVISLWMYSGSSGTWGFWKRRRFNAMPPTSCLMQQQRKILLHELVTVCFCWLFKRLQRKRLLPEWRKF